MKKIHYKGYIIYEMYTNEFLRIWTTKNGKPAGFYHEVTISSQIPKNERFSFVEDCKKWIDDKVK